MSNVLVYNAAQIVTKVSFLIQYRRLFPHPTIQAICKYGIVFLGVWGVAQQFITAFGCVPLSLINPSFRGRCIATNLVFRLNGGMNIATDFAIFAIPIYPVAQLHMPMRRKVHLLGVFCLGFFACAISIIRLLQVIAGEDEPDATWAGAPTAYWSAIELNVGILCACLPTLRPLIKKYAPGALGSSNGDRTSTHRLGTISTRRTRLEIDNKSGIYIQKENEFQSTTELRGNGATKDGASISTDSMDVVITEGQHTSRTAKRT
ncbi:hypothetical protein BKA63DRAFT_430589 [Paraphoma chrysanthemicola]|nr:hypothetical protein BKA63DRAFT_430589 [Paraphoma chrysanthemicola]